MRCNHNEIMPLQYQYVAKLIRSLIYLFVEYSLCYNLVKTRNQYYFSIQSYGILKTAKTSNLKAHNNEKMEIKEKEIYHLNDLLK